MPPVTSWPRTSRPPGDREPTRPCSASSRSITRACWPASRAAQGAQPVAAVGAGRRAEARPSWSKAERRSGRGWKSCAVSRKKRNAANGPSRERLPRSRPSRTPAPSGGPAPGSRTETHRGAAADRRQQRQVGEQQRWRPSSNASPNRQVAAQQQAAARNSAQASSNGYGGLSTGGNLRWPVQGPIPHLLRLARTAELKWKAP